ncbi:MAG TPA: glycosyltransferase family 4 protein [Magnetospirillum sp.]|nr:glycosyltransferase family 4 protein [Magnetospirillum sp.]
MRVFLGVSGQAGQPMALARGLRALGVDASAVCVSSGAFDYECDEPLRLRHDRDHEGVAAWLDANLHRFDVFHFHSRPFLIQSGELRFPSMLDLLMLKAARKAVLFHYRGTEIRFQEAFRQANPHHFCDDDPGGLFARIGDHTKATHLAFVRAVADRILVTDPEIAAYVGEGAMVVPRAIDMDAWPDVGVAENEHPDGPLICHAPSRRGLKGTDSLLAALEQLKAEGVRFRLDLIEGVPNQQARERLMQADLVVDQLRIGWYGVLAVEAMALGKPVVAYLREDLIAAAPAGLPVVSASPDTVADCLRGLLTDAARRRDLARQSRAFCAGYHANTVVARQLADIYRDALATPAPLNVTGAFRLLDHQVALERRMAVEQALRARSLGALWRRLRRALSLQ